MKFFPMASSAVPPVLNYLPSSPFDGQEVYFQSLSMATSGVVWHLRYRSASSSAYKWELLGGSPIFKAETGAAASVTATTIGTATLNNGPTTTIPLPGDYIFKWGGRTYHQSTTATDVFLGLFIGGSYQNQNTDSYQGLTGAPVWAGNTMITDIKNVSLPATTVETRVWASAATGYSSQRWLTAIPIRVSG